MGMLLALQQPIGDLPPSLTAAQTTHHTELRCCTKLDLLVLGQDHFDKMPGTTVDRSFCTMCTKAVSLKV